MKVIRRVNTGDANQICTIYNHYIENSTCTFEEAQLSKEDIENRIISISRNNPWLVYCEGNQVLGYAYANDWKNRSAYRMTKEISVYINARHHKSGLGKSLYKELIANLKESGVHLLVAIITLPNIQSVKMHESFGFIKSGHLHEAGYKFNKWLDVGYWELLLR